MRQTRNKLGPMCQPQRNPRAELKGHVYGAKCIDGQPELSDLMITDHKLELIMNWFRDMSLHSSRQPSSISGRLIWATASCRQADRI